jgi:hypothetical protein
MRTTNPVILSVSHYGDATTAEMPLPKQERMIEALQDPDNWTGNGEPDGILFSGGGSVALRVPDEPRPLMLFADRAFAVSQWAGPAL